MKEVIRVRIDGKIKEEATMVPGRGWADCARCLSPDDDAHCR